MIDENLARLRAHRANIDRYRRLLQGNITELEATFIQRRIVEEEAILHHIAGETFPITLDLSEPSSNAA